MCAKGDILIIKLMDSNSGAIFAACPIAPNIPIDKVVERTVDSSRYFVLTLSDKSGRKAHLGMGFDDRNDAFDFNATIQDFKRQKETPQEVIKPVVKIQAASDLSLKEGQKITVNLKPLRAPPTSQSSQPVFLQPPPASRSRQSADEKPQTDGMLDLLDLGESNGNPIGTSTPPSQPQPQPAAGTSLLD